MSIAALSNSTCTIERIANPENISDYGSPEAPVFEELDTEVVCRYAPRLSNVRGIGGFVGERWASLAGDDIIHNIAVILLPPGTDFGERDRITNVRGQDGVLLDEGPLDPLLVRRTYRGRAEHHVSIIAKRLH